MNTHVLSAFFAARLTNFGLVMCLVVTPAWCKSNQPVQESWQQIWGVGVTRDGQPVVPLVGGSTMEVYHLFVGERYQRGSDAAMVLTVGYHGNQDNFGNASLVRRIPLEAVSSLKMVDHFWLGWGLRYALWPKAQDGNFVMRSLQPGPGLILEAEWTPLRETNEPGGLSFRLVQENFREQSGETRKGWHMGVYMRFGW